MKKYKLQAEPPKEYLKGHSPLIRSLLFNRGVSEESSGAFIDPDYEKGTHPPSLMPDMRKAVSRFLKAIGENEKIIIYSDYDADGICAGALWKNFLEGIGYKNFINYIPHRHEEGYGLNSEAVEELSGGERCLLITLDCGSSDTESVMRANELGMDVIITDHHETSNGLPPAYAILNPKRSDSKYPFKELSGTAVAFKFIQGILEKDRSLMKEGMEKWLLDLVAIATVSDMVPLIDENRVLSRFGFLVLRKSPRKGIMRLCRKLNIPQKTITEDDIGFMITPRINAASRMGSADDAFVLLSTNDEKEAACVADALEHVNNERKGIVASMVKEIKKKVKSSTDNVIVAGNPKWRPSLLGLAANSIAEEFSKPVFLWGRDGNNIIKGSCRSEGSTNVFTLMMRAEHSFIEYGGHNFAGGFSVAFDSIHTLSRELNSAYQELPKKETNEEVLIDLSLSLNDVNNETMKDIERMFPFGMGNPKPSFLFRDVLIEEVSSFGKNNDHLRLKLVSPSGNRIEAMAFFTKANDLTVFPEASLNSQIIANIERSFFRGRSELRLRLIDCI